MESQGNIVRSCSGELAPPTCTGEPAPPRYFLQPCFVCHSFFVKEKLYFGTDRLFFVERELTSTGNPERLALPPCQGVANLTFFFDYSSPWSFLAMERLKDTVSSVFPVNVKIEWVPILLGALFKEIGTPMVSCLA